MKEIYLVKKRGVFYPAYPSDKDVMDSIPVGEIVKAEITRSRNVKLLRKFFALLTVAYENLPENYNMSFDNFREEVIIKAGYYEKYVNFDGATVYKAKSISFAKMDETTFEQVYSDVFDVVLKILHVTEEEINEYINFM
jgi:hypothetical protein